MRTWADDRGNSASTRLTLGELTRKGRLVKGRPFSINQRNPGRFDGSEDTVREGPKVISSLYMFSAVGFKSF